MSHDYILRRTHNASLMNTNRAWSFCNLHILHADAEYDGAHTLTDCTISAHGNVTLITRHTSHSKTHAGTLLLSNNVRGKECRGLDWRAEPPSICFNLGVKTQGQAHTVTATKPCPLMFLLELLACHCPFIYFHCISNGVPMIFQWLLEQWVTSNVQQTMHEIKHAGPPVSVLL